MEKLVVKQVSESVIMQLERWISTGKIVQDGIREWI